MNIGGTGGLITTPRVQTATKAVTVVADIYTFKQSSAATRFMRTPSWRCTRTSSTRSTASWRRAARASLRSSGSVAAARYSAGRFWVVNDADEPHDHGSATSDLWVTSSGFTIVDRFGAQIELIPHLFGATNRLPAGRGILYIWRSSSGVTKPNALRLICSECRSPRAWDRLEPSFATFMGPPGCQLWDHRRVVRRGGRCQPLAITSSLVMTWRSLVAFREVRVIEIREVLRCWLAGDGLRTAAERAGVDRKTARRYVEAGGGCRPASATAARIS